MACRLQEAGIELAFLEALPPELMNEVLAANNIAVPAPSVQPPAAPPAQPPTPQVGPHSPPRTWDHVTSGSVGLAVPARQHAATATTLRPRLSSRDSAGPARGSAPLSLAAVGPAAAFLLPLTAVPQQPVRAGPGRQAFSFA